MSDKVEALAKVDLLSGLNRRHLDLIARVTEQVTLDADTEFVVQGQVMTHMSILVDGAARVDVDGVQVATLGPGDVIGELSIIDGAPASATVTFTETSTIWLVARAGFLPVWDKNRADMATAMLGAIINKLRETNKLVAG